MKLTKLLSLLGSIAFTCAPLAVNAATLPYNNIIFFGDSLTDNGNFYSKTLKYIPKSPPYYIGRFSNGPTWAELVATHYKESNQVIADNFGIGGSTAYFHNPIKGYVPYTLKMAVNSYLVRYALSDKTHTLYSIWIGGNDYFYGAKNVDDATTKVVNSIQKSIQTLINRGGKYFLVMNLPDLALTPYGQASENPAHLSELISEHNRKLKFMVEKLQKMNSGITIHLYDMYNDFDTLNKNPEVFNKKYNINLTNLTEACWPGGYTLTNNKQAAITKEVNQYWHHNGKGEFAPEQMSDAIAYSPALSSAYDVGVQYQAGQQPCQNPDNRVFWDTVHPSRVVHSTFAKIMIDYIDQNFSG